MSGTISTTIANVGAFMSDIMTAEGSGSDRSRSRGGGSSKQEDEEEKGIFSTKGVDSKTSSRTKSGTELTKGEQNSRRSSFSSRRIASKRQHRRHHQNKEREEQHRIDVMRKHQFDDFKEGYGEVYVVCEGIRGVAARCNA